MTLSPLHSAEGADEEGEIERLFLREYCFVQNSCALFFWKKTILPLSEAHLF